MKQYHGKFAKPKDDIDYEEYNCSSYWHNKVEDSTLVDSTEVATDIPVTIDGEDQETEEGVVGNEPTVGEQEGKKAEATEKKKTEATEKKKKKQPQYEDVYL